MSHEQKLYYTPDLCRVIGRSRDWVHEAIRKNHLPKPVRVGKRNAWPKHQIDQLFSLNAAAQPATQTEASK